MHTLYSKSLDKTFLCLTQNLVVVFFLYHNKYVIGRLVPKLCYSVYKVEIGL